MIPTRLNLLTETFQKIKEDCFTEHSTCINWSLATKNDDLVVSFQTSVLQIVAGHRSLLTIWVSWSVKINADFLK